MNHARRIVICRVAINRTLHVATGILERIEYSFPERKLLIVPACLRLIGNKYFLFFQVIIKSLAQEFYFRDDAVVAPFIN